MRRALAPAEPAAPEPRTHARIFAVVARIPRGKVATYGQVARLAGRVTARLVGYAMASAPSTCRGSA